VSITTYGLSRDVDIIGGYAAYGFGISILAIITAVFVQIVEEELRLCLIANENRNWLIEDDLRNESIKFENRTIIIEE
jgi:hypothetical protein